MNLLIKSILRRVFVFLSKISVRSAVKNNDELNTIWNLSCKVLPDLGDHYAIVRLDEEAEMRVRMLTCAQVVFLKRVVTGLLLQKKEMTYLDVGDTDGAVRLLFKEMYPEFPLIGLGINLQKKAVENITSKGLSAECIDAMDLHKQGRTYDIVSVFETLEHLPNPIGFLESIYSVVNERLIISVPVSYTHLTLPTKRIV